MGRPLVPAVALDQQLLGCLWKTWPQSAIRTVGRSHRWISSSQPGHRM